VEENYSDGNIGLRPNQ